MESSLKINISTEIDTHIDVKSIELASSIAENNQDEVLKFLLHIDDFVADNNFINDLIRNLKINANK